MDEDRQAELYNRFETVKPVLLRHDLNAIDALFDRWAEQYETDDEDENLGEILDEIEDRLNEAGTT